MTHVLDHGYVKTIETWGSDERIIEAARMSTGKGFLGWGGVCPKHPGTTQHDPAVRHCVYCNDEIKPIGQGDEKLLGFLWRKRHTSPFEQCGLSIEVQAPIAVFREWHRHRTQSYNEFSARYAQMPNLHYVPTLERLKVSGGANKQAQGVAPLASDAELNAWLEDLAAMQEQIYEHYARGLMLGVPKEVARLNTPVSRYSKMVASANLLNWLRFLGLRMPKDAQWEIRQFAEVVGGIIGSHFPRTWELFQESKI